VSNTEVFLDILYSFSGGKSAAAKGQSRAVREKCMRRALCKNHIAFCIIFAIRIGLIRNRSWAMTQAEVLSRIERAIESAPRNAYVAELHLQVIKYADKLEGMSGREFCEGVGLKPAWGTEFVKMRKIAPRLVSAGLDTSRI
jgi:hypothetical protein